MSNKDRIRKIVVTGALAAVTVVLGITGLGFIIIPGGTSLTIMHVPVIIGAILEGPVVGMSIGFLFGIFSIIQAGIIGVSAVDLAFVNYPLIAIVPRVCIGIAAWGIYRLIAGKRQEAGSAKTIPVWREIIAIIAGAVVGSLTNTLLVLGSFGIIKLFPWELIGISAVANGPLEAAGAAILTLAIVGAWKGISTRRGPKLLAGK
ncbi:MAG: ECF transporter S component [Spirochaetaceae bacterium]|jgi:uncharacterized membrane protein|nr:ECF transporter S component [Spirochaetaceae bacterium]